MGKWTGHIWVSSGTSSCFEHGNEPSGSVKCGEFLDWLTEVPPRTGHEDLKREYRYSCALSLTSAPDGSGWLTPLPGRFTPGKVTRYPFYRRLCGPQDQSGRVRKVLPTGIRSLDRPARNESLYRLSYPGPQVKTRIFFKASLNYIWWPCINRKRLFRGSEPTGPNLRLVVWYDKDHYPSGYYKILTFISLSNKASKDACHDILRCRKQRTKHPSKRTGNTRILRKLRREVKQKCEPKRK
jgi:hypothetical protein